MQIILPILLVLCAYYFSKSIRLNSIILYIVAILLSSMSLLYNSELFSLITTGYLGLSFFTVVMYTGIFKGGSKLKTQLSRVRKDYAIIGFILITPHAYLHILDSIQFSYPLQYFALLAYLLMVPLFITSFRITRTKMATSNWLRLHRFAYLIYLFVFLHAINVSNGLTVVLYYVIFSVYAFLALKKGFTSHSSLKAATVTLLVGSLSLLFVTNIIEYLEPSTNALEEHTYNDGVFIGYAKGYQNLDTIVRVSITNNHIDYVIIEECGCTTNSSNGFYSSAAYNTAIEIKIQNRTDIDSVAGATATCSAINKAVINALEAAEIE